MQPLNYIKNNWKMLIPALIGGFLLLALIVYNVARIGSPFRFFTWSEFDSPDYPGSGKLFMNKNFIHKLDRIRARAGIPFIINSAYRTHNHNADVGGVADSAHLSGYAVDIYAPTYFMKLKIAQAAIAEGITRIGWGENFIHLDGDPTKNQQTVWGYGNSGVPSYTTLAA